MRNCMDENDQDKTQSKSIVAKDLKQGKANNEKIAFSSKGVWDWLNLLGVLAIPFVVTIVGLYFTQQITLQQAQLSIATNKQQHQIDLQIAGDQQRETTLITYLDN